ncbi:hypothetical protein BDR26DRAFT_851217 [Obelidium mucronatum]|nr:hypothetical protein BDR26DRAFT_851217 [Obelidium mucronatum]
MDEFSSDDEDDEDGEDNVLFLDPGAEKHASQMGHDASTLPEPINVPTTATAESSSSSSPSSSSNQLRRRRLFPSLPRFRSLQKRNMSSGSSSSNLALDTDQSSSSNPSLPTWRTATTRRLRQIPKRIRRNVGTVATATTGATSLVAFGAILLLAVLWIVKMRGWSWLPKFWQLVS